MLESQIGKPGYYDKKDINLLKNKLKPLACEDVKEEILAEIVPKIARATGRMMASYINQRFGIEGEELFAEAKRFETWCEALQDGDLTNDVLVDILKDTSGVEIVYVDENGNEVIEDG